MPCATSAKTTTAEAARSTVCREPDLRDQRTPALEPGALGKLPAERAHALLGRRIGFGIGEARTRAFTLYGYVVSESMMPNQGAAARKAERGRLLEAMLTHKA